MQSCHIPKRDESGFTLIELLTIIGLIGVLAALSLSGFALYRASAAYAVADTTLYNARLAMDSSQSDADHPPTGVPLTSQSTAGPILGSDEQLLLPGMQIGNDMTLYFGYDPTCTDGDCPWESYLQANHCKGKEYTRWLRFGDGVEVKLNRISGSGCG